MVYISTGMVTPSTATLEGCTRSIFFLGFGVKNTTASILEREYSHDTCTAVSNSIGDLSQCSVIIVVSGSVSISLWRGGRGIWVTNARFLPGVKSLECIDSVKPVEVAGDPVML